MFDSGSPVPGTGPVPGADRVPGAAPAGGWGSLARLVEAVRRAVDALAGVPAETVGGAAPAELLAGLGVLESVGTVLPWPRRR